jgi:hypothetical protein
MHFELKANNNPRIWTKHAGVEVDPRENERLLEARARDYSAAKSLPYGGPFEPLMKPGYVAKASVGCGMRWTCRHQLTSHAGADGEVVWS